MDLLQLTVKMRCFTLFSQNRPSTLPWWAYQKSKTA